MWVPPPRTTQLKPPRTLPPCWFARRVLARPYSVARSKSLHCLCTALAYRRSLWTRSSLESEKFTVRNPTHASSPRCRMGLGISRGGSRRASMPSARLVPTTGSEERGLLTRRVAQSCREPFQEHRVSLGWQNVFFLLQIKGGQRAKVNTVVTRAR